MKIKKIKYKISLGNYTILTSQEEVEGIPYGVFALRKTDAGKWQIDHMPSGFRVFWTKLNKKKSVLVIEELSKITKAETVKKAIQEIKKYKKGKWLDKIIKWRIKK